MWSSAEACMEHPQVAAAHSGNFRQAPVSLQSNPILGITSLSFPFPCPLKGQRAGYSDWGNVTPQFGSWWKIAKGGVGRLKREDTGSGNGYWCHWLRKQRCWQGNRESTNWLWVHFLPLGVSPEGPLYSISVSKLSRTSGNKGASVFPHLGERGWWNVAGSSHPPCLPCGCNTVVINSEFHWLPPPILTGSCQWGS